MSFKSGEEKLLNATLLEEPRSLLEQYIDFLSGEARDVQRYDEKRKGLISFKKYQGTKNVPLELDNEEITVYHCSKEGTKLSKALTLGLETSLQSRIKYLQESLQSGNLKRVGEALNGSLLGEGVDCRTCRKRFALRLIFDPEKVDKLLEKLRTKEN